MGKKAYAYVAMALSISAILGSEPAFSLAKSSNTGSSVNQFGWQIPKQTLKFSYYAGQGDPKQQAEYNKLLYPWLLKNFNVSPTEEVDATNQDQRLNLMLASGNYPDVLTGLTQAEADRWIQQGKAVDLAPLVSQYGPKIKKDLGIWYKRYTDGSHLWELPTYFGYLSIPDYAIHIRYDWWLQAGSPPLRTPDEYLKALAKIQKMHPTNGKGQKVYGLTAWDWLNDTVPTLGGVWGLKNGWEEQPGHKLVFWPDTKQGLDMTLWLNKAYRMGLLDPASFTNTTIDQFGQEVSNQQTIGYIGAWWETWHYGHENWQKTLKNWNQNMRFMQYQMAAPGVKHPTLSPKNFDGGSYTIITNHCKDPAGVIKFMNFLASDTGTRIAGWGIPNLSNSLWTYNKGHIAWKPWFVKAMLNNTLDYNAAYGVGAGQLNLFSNIGLMTDKGSRYGSYWFDQNFNQASKWKKMLNNNMKGTEYDDTMQEITIPPNTPQSIQQTQVNDMLLTGWEKAIQSPSAAQCKTAFLQLRSQLDKAGLTNIEQFTTSVYQNRLKGTWNQYSQ